MKNKYYDLLSLALGDGYLQNRRGYKKAMLDIANHISHSDFVKYKGSFLEKWEISHKYSKKTNTNGTKLLRCFTKHYKIIEDIRKKLYKNGKKTFRYNWIKYLTAEHLAILWMDDGHYGRQKTPYGHYNFGELATQSFDKKGNENIVLWLKKFNINAYIIYNKKRNFYYVKMNRNNLNRLCEVVEPYICKSMIYKIGF